MDEMDLAETWKEKPAGRGVPASCVTQQLEGGENSWNSLG